jgi:hypothetical protein
MNHILLGFLFRCWRTTLFQVLWTALMIVWLPVPLTTLLLLAVISVLFGAFFGWVFYGQWRPNVFWMWRLSRRVVRFCTVKGDRVSLLFPTGLDETIELQEVIKWSESDLDEFSERFGVRLSRRLIIVLIPSHRDLTADFGRLMGGTALFSANAVVLAVDCPLREILRHELVHLFAARWNGCAPPLIQEGLAVWLQETEPDRTNTALHLCVAQRFDTDPSLLLSPQYFFAPQWQRDSYALAGVFTGFLIRRFGWDRYKRFYRMADPWTVRSAFKRQFGMGLEEAWRRCPDECVAMASLNRRLQEDWLFNPLL